MQFELERYNRNVPDEELLAELRRVATLLVKEAVTIDQFNEHAKFHSSTLSRRFGSWFKALEAAGLKKTRHLHLTDEQLFENLDTAWLKLGRQPKYNDLNDKGVSFYSPGTYENRFGTWRGALAAFVDWANSGVLPNATAEKEKAPSALRGSRNINWRLRAIVLMRDGARCQLCGAEARDGAKLHIDHIRPWSKGGETALSNLRVLCAQCNIGKSDVEMGDVSL